MEYIFKYQLSVQDRQEIEMPIDAVILSMQMQGEVPCIWVRTEKIDRKIKRKFALVGTGCGIPSDAGDFIGTIQLSSGALVFHLFELMTSSAEAA